MPILLLPLVLTPLLSLAHYGDPNKVGGCMKDEVKIQIQGLSGDLCSPACSSSDACPTDVPKGVTAQPQCVLKSSTGGQNCALVCTPSTDEGDAQCGDKASCKAIQNIGLCTYDDVPPPPSSAHWVPLQSPTFQEQSVVLGVSFEKNGKIGYAGAGNNNVGATVIKSTDAGQSWEVVHPKNSSKPAFNLYLAAATKSGAQAVVSGIINDLWTIDGGDFFPSISGFLSPAQDAHVLPTGDFGLVGTFGKKSGVAVSKTGLKWDFRTYSNVNSTLYPARYGAFPSENVWYVTAGKFPSSNAMVAAKLENIQPISNNIHFHMDGLEGKYGFSFKENKENDDPVPCSVDPSNCFSAMILKTTDGGSTWDVVYQDKNNSNIYPNGIHCTSETHCVAVLEGETARIIVTRDGGKTWKESMYDTDSKSSLMAVHMVDDNEVWASGGHISSLSFEGRYWHSLDGGDTWVKEAIPGLYILNLDILGKQAGFSTALTFQQGVELLKYRSSNQTEPAVLIQTANKST